MFAKIQTAIAAKLQAHPGVPAQMKIIAREEKDVENDILAAVAKLGICLYVMPLLPLRCLPTENNIIFFESVEIRVRVIEDPLLAKRLGFGVYDGMAATMLALQGFSPLDANGEPLFAAPLGLAATPVSFVEDEETRIADVIFNVALQLQP